MTKDYVRADSDTDGRKPRYSALIQTVLLGGGGGSSERDMSVHPSEQTYRTREGEKKLADRTIQIQIQMMMQLGRTCY